MNSNMQNLLGLTVPPVAIGLFETPPAGVQRWSGGEAPAGCSYWKEAQRGQTFYTVPADHYGCAVGAYTHGIPLPMARENELMDTVGFMVEAAYISMDEVPGIPKLGETPQYIAYGPADSAGFEPTVVLVAAAPASAMLLYEAVIAAGAGSGLMSVLGRPGCAVVPLSHGGNTVALSFGCAGNRTFTGLPDQQMYVCIPGSKWHAVAEKVAAVCAANATMKGHYDSKLVAVAVQ